MQKKAIRSLLWMQALLCAMFLFACSNDDDNSNAPLPKPDPKELKVQVAADTKANTATVSVANAPAEASLSLVLDVKRGKALDQASADKNGTHTFKLPLLAGYEQKLKLVVKSGATSAEVKNLTLPAAEEQYTDEQIAQGLQKHKWLSDQERSRIIVDHTSSNPYHMFVNKAVKHFEFLPNSKFNFTVTSPLQWNFPNGKWSVKNKRVDIDTRIPLDAMHLGNSRIQTLTEKEMVILTEVDGGLFLLWFTAE